MLRIAICDDDLRFLDHFAQMLSEAFADAGQPTKISTFSDGKFLIETVEKEKRMFDVVFLDVEMPVIHGFQVAQRLRELNAACLLLFTTYMEHQSREGYRYGAFRYMFKNHLEAEIGEAVSGILKKLGIAAVERECVTFRCRTSGTLENLTLQKSDILFLQSEKTRRIALKTVCAEYELLTKPLSEYAKQLQPPVFMPIMRSYLLNFNHVEGIRDGFFVLTGGATVPLGVKREVRKSSVEKYLKFLEERV
ncbi:MAG: LytTR family DNA-binding domain-containing protein [Firmicutes bacterium]|nr:LytTR family DNA-binding domain-containing protein [Bacillota bacterium]